MSKILIAVDLSPMAQDVIQQGCCLAQAMNAKATIIHCVPNLATWRGYQPALPDTMEEELEKAAQTKLESFVELVKTRDAGLVETIEGLKVYSGDPSTTITDFAKEEGVQLIVLGHRGQSKLERLLVGSTASAVANLAPMSVLILHPDQPLF